VPFMETYCGSPLLFFLHRGLIIFLHKLIYLMPKFLEEFGKHLLTLATAVITLVVLQPLMHEKLSKSYALLGLAGYLILLCLSLLSFWFNKRFRIEAQ